MDIKSQEQVSIVEYAVWWADWADGGKDDWLSWPDKSKIDDRTERTKIFPTKEEAIKFAKDMLEDREDDKWLAYIEIKKCHITVIEKIK